MVKCTICERRPANSGGYCAPCLDKMASERKAKVKIVPRYFLTYRGNVVGLFPNGNRTLIPRLLQRSVENLPKGKTLDLNHYCDGFSRGKIKEFKACVLKLAHA